MSRIRRIGYDVVEEIGIEIEKRKMKLTVGPAHDSGIQETRPDLKMYGLRSARIDMLNKSNLGQSGLLFCLCLGFFKIKLTG